MCRKNMLTIILDYNGSLFLLLIVQFIKFEIFQIQLIDLCLDRMLSISHCCEEKDDIILDQTCYWKTIKIFFSGMY